MDNYVDMLKSKKVTELYEIARQLKIPVHHGMKKVEIVAQIAQSHTENDGNKHGEGVLEIFPDGFGFLRSYKNNYLPGENDIYISPVQIRRLHLRKGDLLSGQARPMKEGDKHASLERIDLVNGIILDPEKRRVNFDNLTPLYPAERLKL